MFLLILASHTLQQVKFQYTPIHLYRNIARPNKKPLCCVEEMHKAFSSNLYTLYTSQFSYTGTAINSHILDNNVQKQVKYAPNNVYGFTM